jgi:hypothetical protein
LINGQSENVRIHHVPAKALAAGTIDGYAPPPSPNEVCIVLPRAEHEELTPAQFTKGIGRLENPTAGQLVTRDFFLLRKYTQAPASAVRNLAGMIKGRYPSIFRAR